MTENKAARTVEEPVGYDHTPTERIPVQGDIPDGMTTGEHRRREPEDDLAVTEDTGTTTESTDLAEPVEPAEPTAEHMTATEEPVAATEEPVSATASHAEPDERAEFFTEDIVRRFNDRWRELQAGFVDDPGQAVRGADELVGEIMRELAEHKQSLEQHWGAGPADTEELRVVIREYRVFFNQLLNS